MLTYGDRTTFQSRNNPVVQVDVLLAGVPVGHIYRSGGKDREWWASTELVRAVNGNNYFLNPSQSESLMKSKLEFEVCKMIKPTDPPVCEPEDIVQVADLESVERRVGSGGGHGAPGSLRASFDRVAASPAQGELFAGFIGGINHGQ